MTTPNISPETMTSIIAKHLTDGTTIGGEGVGYPCTCGYRAYSKEGWDKAGELFGAHVADMLTAAGYWKVEAGA